jgi:hypothetical protein
MKVRYDLAERIVSFDFSSWLYIAAAKGASEIVFANAHRIKENKWPYHVARRRFESILLPMPALIGLKASVGDDDGVEMDHSTDPSDLVRWVYRRIRKGYALHRYRTVLPPGRERYTVTLRNDWRLPQFNSNSEAWLEFASEIGAKVIGDYDDAPLHLHERFALYAGAEMNFGTVSGPMHLITLSRHPAMIFKANVLGAALRKAGIEDGRNYPWAVTGQNLVWEDDDLESIRRNFKAMR